MEILKKLFKNLPTNPGVYIFKNHDSIPIYVGKAKNIKLRLKSYSQNSNLFLAKTKKMITEINSFQVIPVESEFEALLLEAELIKKLKPKYNTVLKDDKSYLYIKIDKTSEIPIVTTSRREKPSKKNVLFGPYPSSSKVKYVLKTIRSIFPYCVHKRKQASCLYVHLGLCPDPYLDFEKRQQYFENISNIRLFLQGKKKELANKLKKEMKQFAGNLQFEKAEEIKQKLIKIEAITQFARQPQDYIDNPNLVSDLLKQKLVNIKRFLNLNRLPKRIECFDISNIQGKSATGSMSVAINGQLQTSQYRRFKIRSAPVPNDPLMVEEVLTRRFKNNWPTPDLIIIDGGKTQLNAAVKIVKKLKVNVNLATLAKRLEQIYTLESQKPLNIPRTNSGLQLIQSLRDEAHRFAITYHRKLRNAQTFDFLKKRMIP